MSNIVRYNGEGAILRGPSPALWGDLGKIRDDADRGCCVFDYEDFVRGALVDATAETGDTPFWRWLADTGVAVDGLNVSNLSDALGELRITHDGTDEDEAYVQFARGKNHWISNSSGNTAPTFFETRVKVSSIADSGATFFVGLSGVTPVANALVDATGAFITTGDFIGFRTLAADGDVLEFVFQAASQTVNTVVDAHTLVADDYVKVGFKYDPNAVDPAKKITIFVNGVDIGTYVSTTDIDAVTFPESVALAPSWFTKVTDATAHLYTMDWYASAQYQDSGAAN